MNMKVKPKRRNGLKPAGYFNVQIVPFLRAFFSGNTESDRILSFEDTEVVTDSRLKRARRSLSYKVAEKLTLFEGLRKRWNYTPHKLEKYIRDTDQSERTIPPKSFYKKLHIEEKMIDGFPCYFLSPKKRAPNASKAIFYFHGGGFIYEMHPIHWVFAERIVTSTSMTMCIPMYPLYPVIDPEEIIRVVIDSYIEFCARNPNAQIIALGDSAGSNLNLSFHHYIKKNNLNLRYPTKVILVSPAMVVGNDESVIEKMKKIEPYDVMLSVNILKTLPQMYRFPEGELNWWTAPLHGDFSEFSSIYLFSGTRDIFYPQMASFVERLRAQGKHVVFITGHEMMHDWPVVPVAPECEKALNRVIEIIKE